MKPPRGISLGELRRSGICPAPVTVSKPAAVGKTETNAAQDARLFDRDDQPEQRARVTSALAPTILAYRDHIVATTLHATFTAQGLRDFVEARHPGTAPASADRILRELRRSGELDYVVENRRRSLYRFKGGHQ